MGICGDMKGVRTYRNPSVDNREVRYWKEPEHEELCREGFRADPDTE